MKNTKKRLVLLGLFAFFGCTNLKSTQVEEKTNWDGSSLSEDESRFRIKTGTKGMVVSDDEIASKFGAEILRKGGNAIDAAVGVGFMLAVTRPHYASIGGGGFLVYCPKKQKCKIIDYREVAPLAATRDMYVINGKGDTELSQDGALASGVPGVVAGLLLALEKYGTKSRTDVLSEPIRVAKEGMHLSSTTEAAAADRWSKMNLGAKKIFGCKELKNETHPCFAQSIIKQKDLSSVLTEIKQKGKNGFYRGWVSKKIVHEMHKDGGILSEKDFAQYRVVEREPIVGKFLNHEVITMPPPSSGGAILLQLLKFTELAIENKLFDTGYGSALTTHVLAHAMKLSFSDRSLYFGDPNFVRVPVDELLSKDYIQQRWNSFNPTSSKGEVIPGLGKNEKDYLKENNQTTHFSVVDSEGTAVAITTTVNGYFGSAYVPEGTGIVMNNEMDDFSIQPGVPNLFGLVGGYANSVQPMKRPLSSMTPTILRNEKGEVEFILGAQGGPRIITGVFQSLVNRLVFNFSLADAVSAPRIHHQWKPDVLNIEFPGPGFEVVNKLKEIGYTVKPTSSVGRLEAIERFPAQGRVWGVADPRTEGYAAAQ